MSVIEYISITHYNKMTSEFHSTIKKTDKLVASCFNKVTNFLPWVPSIEERFEDAIETLKLCATEAKIKKDLVGQIIINERLDEYYRKYYQMTNDNSLKLSHVTILRDIITLKNKSNIQTITTHSDTPIYDILEQMKTMLAIVLDTPEEYHIRLTLRFILDYYVKKQLNLQELDFVIDCYDKMKAMTGKNDEHLAELLIIYKNQYSEAANIFEEIASQKNSMSRLYDDLLLIKAICCYICLDEVLAQKKI